MIDIEAYLAALMEQSYAANPYDEDVWVAPDIDVDTVADHIPAVTWNIQGDGEEQDVDETFGILLNANVLGNGMDQAKGVAKHFDGLVMEWFDDPAPTLIEIDGVRMVVSLGWRQDLITRIAQAEVEGRNLVQYSGSYRLLIRSA